jgi:dTDP-4-dehydrorhamnose reductase
MDKLLLLGADSMLGANLALALEDRFDGTGVSCQLPHVAGCRQTVVGDPLDAAFVARLVAEEQPDWIVYSGPTSHSSWEARADEQPPSAIEVVRQLVAATAESGAALSIISSDAVFAGPRLFHEEQSRATADTPYAHAALALEESLAGTHALVVRTHAYGWSPSEEAPGPIDTLVDKLSASSGASGDGLCYATPILATDLAELLAAAYEKDLHGLYHITGAERTNQSRFVSELAAALDLPQPLAAAGSVATVAPLVDRPVAETSLNTRRARRDLGLPMPLLREGLERLAAQRDNGFRARDRKSVV